ncbi:MAG: VWA domain-containing protein [Thermoguttaceae bacterium]|nr:VWA domain-containing protein [Thermoguttaceae bacterium]MBQ9798420.1 VWA domain-containing protein [Thermoguttaceae bacterium]
MAKKLPVYLLLDTSGSMSGEPIQAVANGICTFGQAISSDPYALETMHVGVITFDSEAKEVVPLTEAAQFQPPTLVASGCTELGAALRLVKQCAERDVKKSTSAKRDWKPLVFILTDGGPTDDWQQGLQEFNQYKWGTVVACAAGAGADDSVLRQITNNVVYLSGTDADSLKAFFKWVTVASSLASQNAGAGAGAGDGLTLTKLPPLPEGVTLAKP